MLMETTKTAEQVATLLASLGVDKSAYTNGTLTVTSPIDGEVIAKVPETSAADAGKAIDAAHKAFLQWRNIPAPKRGELVRLFGEELRAPQGRSRPAGLARSRQGDLGRAWRGSGNDRHLRFRGRPVAPDLRPDHRHRTLKPPHDGNLAPARRGRHHLGLQLPGRGVGMECRPGFGLRRRHRLEAVGKVAADRHRHPCHFSNAR